MSCSMTCSGIDSKNDDEAPAAALPEDVHTSNMMLTKSNVRLPFSLFINDDAELEPVNVGKDTLKSETLIDAEEIDDYETVEKFAKLYRHMMPPGRFQVAANKTAFAADDNLLRRRAALMDITSQDTKVVKRRYRGCSFVLETIFEDVVLDVSPQECQRSRERRLLYKDMGLNSVPNNKEDYISSEHAYID